MKERPILFSGPMVRAILEGRKTQTRRPLKLPHGLWETSATGELVPIPAGCPYGQPGDRLWVRETFSDDWCDKGYPVQYRADGDLDVEMFDAGVKWRPAIFMPRKLSRITLEVSGVRVERLQEISEGDAIKEGFPPLVAGVSGDGGWARDRFCDLWDQINAKRAPWASNPWVWVIEFKRVAP